MPSPRVRWALVVVALLAAARAGAAPGGARIVRVTPLPDRPYLLVDLDYGRAAIPGPERSVTFEADGQPVPARPLGAAGEPRRTQATWLVQAGERCRRLVARWGEGPGRRTAPVAVEDLATPRAVLLNRVGDREALVSPVPLHFQVFPPAVARFFHDGAPIAAERIDADGPGQRLRLSPLWHPGLNAVRMRLEGPGGRAEREFTFVVLTEGGLAVGEAVRLVYGDAHGAGGAAPRLHVEGEALAVAGDGLATVRVVGDDGWILDHEVHVATLQARAAGKATLRLEGRSSLEAPDAPTELHLRVGAAP